MLDRCLDDFFQFTELRISRMHSMMTSCLLREGDRIDRYYDITKWSSLRLRTDWCRRTCLTCGERVVFIIEHYIRDIEIATTRVDEVPHTYTIAISVTTDCDDGERWICHLHSGRKRERATMKGLRGISVDILARLP